MAILDSLIKVNHLFIAILFFIFGQTPLICEHPTFTFVLLLVHNCRCDAHAGRVSYCHLLYFFGVSISSIFQTCFACIVFHHHLK